MKQKNSQVLLGYRERTTTGITQETLKWTGLLWNGRDMEKRDASILQSLDTDDTLLGKYANELNPVLGLDGKPTGFWTIPESFNETTGTEFIYNPDTGEYKRISLSDPKYKYLM